MVIGYSMPPYDLDFKTLLIKGLMANKNRKNVPIKIITQGSKTSAKELEWRFKYLAGKVEVVSRNGFCNYMKEKLNG